MKFVTIQIIGLALLGLWTSDSKAQSKYRLNQIENIQEIALRHMLLSVPFKKDDQSKSYIAFISVTGKDPSDRFFQRFANLKISMKKASSSHLGKGKSGTSLVRRYVQDKKTKQRGVVLNVQDIRWIHNDKVLVSVNSYYGPPGGIVSEYTVIKRKGHWRVIDNKILQRS